MYSSIRTLTRQVLEGHQQKTYPDPVARSFLQQALEHVFVAALDAWWRLGYEVLCSNLCKLLLDIWMILW